MSAHQPFNPKLVIGLIVAGVVAFGALLLLLAYGGNMSSGRDGRAHALSISAVGYKGLVDLVGQFRETRVIRDDGDLGAENLLVVSLEETSRPEALDALLRRRGPRATLIILPKWMTLPFSRRGWVQALGPGAGEMAAAQLGKNVTVRIADGKGDRPAVAEGRDMLEGLRLPVPPSPQLVSGDGLVPLVSLPGGALLARIGDAPHYVLADPDLLNNYGLRDLANARAALALIDSLNQTDARRVDFDVTMNGLGRSAASPNMLRTAFEPPFLAMTLALVVAAVLAGLHGAFRFGPTRAEERAIAFGKAALVENSAGLIRLAGRETRLGGAYADVVRNEAARAAAAPHWLQSEALDAYLDRLTPPGSPRFSELAAALLHARDRSALMAAARNLHQWKKDIIP